MTNASFRRSAERKNTRTGEVEPYPVSRTTSPPSMRPVLGETEATNGGSCGGLGSGLAVRGAARGEVTEVRTTKPINAPTLMTPPLPERPLDQPPAPLRRRFDILHALNHAGSP